MSTPQTVGFLDIPVELRLDIYEMVLVYPRPLIWQDTSAEVNTYYDNDTKTISSNVFALLAVCQRIHDECLDIFYRKNTFRLPVLEAGLRTTIKSHPNLSLVQHVQLDSPKVNIRQEDRPHLIKIENLRETIDTSASSCLQDVLDGCLSLKTFKVFLPDSFFYEIFPYDPNRTIHDPTTHIQVLYPTRPRP